MYPCRYCGEYVKQGLYDALHPLVEKKTTDGQYIFFCEGCNYGLRPNHDYKPPHEIEQHEKKFKCAMAKLKKSLQKRLRNKK